MSWFTRGVLIGILGCQFGVANAAGSAYAIGRVIQMGGQGLGPNLVYFGISPAPTTRAYCNTHSDYQFVIDISSSDGKALYSALLMVRASGLTIAVKGTGNCLGDTTMETVSYWVVQPD